MRDFSVKVKLNPVRSFLEGKKVIVIEDSIIRGTTGKSRIRSLREVGVKEVHMLISCPPTRNPCYYGIDFPSNTELIASMKSVDEIRQYLDLDTLYYLSLEGMIKATGADADIFCKACFDGKYPVPPDTTFNKLSLGKK
jgi:amidophosphoribosyltransferase